MAGAAALVALAAFAALAGLYWPALWEACTLDRDAVLAGQVWRLWSGHLMHLDLRHAGINLAALAILAVVAARWRRLVPLLLVSAVLMPALGLAVLLVLPQLHWYVGLSGLLHGWLAWLLLVRGSRLAWAGLALLAIKLACEAVGLGGAAAWVIHEAHWLGALLGAVLAWPARWRVPAQGPDTAATP